MVRKGAASDISGALYAPPSSVWQGKQQSELSSALIRQTTSTKFGGAPQTPIAKGKDSKRETSNINVSVASRRKNLTIEKNFVLDVKNPVYTHRQSIRRVGNFYTKLINERVF